jgi:hypothetical protein
MALEAQTAKGTKVFCCINKDCKENEGGYWVEICLDEDLERYDDFCIHPCDCDCNDYDAVEKYVVSYVSKIAEY